MDNGDIRDEHEGDVDGMLLEKAQEDQPVGEHLGVE